MKRFSWLFFLPFLLSSLSAQSISKEQSYVAFELTSFGVNKVKGTFKGMEGEITFSAEEPGNGIFSVCIDPATVNSGIELRDKHLKEEDYFDVAAYPSICFQSKRINKTSSGYQTTGTLTMHGVSKEVSIPFTLTNKTLKGTFTIDRTDYGVGPKSGFSIEKEVELTIVCALE